MIELNEIKVKEKPRYVEPIKKKKNIKDKLLIAFAIIVVITYIVMVASTLILKSIQIKNQQAEIDRLQNKVYQDIELIDSLKQVY